MIVDVQEPISSYSLNEISLSSTPWTQKLVYKRLEARDSSDSVSKQFDYSNCPEMLDNVEEHLNL